MEHLRNIYDISVPLGMGSVDWPGMPSYSRELICDMKNGAALDVSKISLVCHVGTHVDTPAHFIPNGKNIDKYPIERWIVPAQVVCIEDRKVIRPPELERLDISRRVSAGVFSEEYVYISLEAADLLINKGVGLIGIDYASVDSFPLGDAPCHHKILSEDILILEGINLKNVPAGKYMLFCLPLMVSGAEGAPARVVLVD
jgi:arylformamidase